MTTLTPFGGHDVLSTKAAITKAGDGLSKALGVDPVELDHGERVYVVLECEVEKIRFDPVKDSDGLVRVHVLGARSATIVEEGLVADALDAQARRIEEAAGVQRIGFDDDVIDDVFGEGQG